MFTRVIDEGSFAAAARAINVSPAVVTRLIAELEEHLGARLINRTTRRLVLTETGESYLERVRQILMDLEDAEALATASTVEARRRSVPGIPRSPSSSPHRGRSRRSTTTSTSRS